MKKLPFWIAGIVVLFVFSCNKDTENSDAGTNEIKSNVDFVPYTIEDSSKIRKYSNGLELYIVKEGPGEYPSEGQNITMHYHGTLANGNVFDSSYMRDEPFRFTLGQSKVIKGLEEGVRRIRFGSQAILIIPPDLAYGEEGSKPNIPPNSTLTFNIDLLGYF